MRGRRPQGGQKGGRSSTELQIIDCDVWRLAWRLPLCQHDRSGKQEQWAILIRCFGQQHLRYQFVFDVGMRGVIFMMIGMPAEVLEMHEVRWFLSVETDMVVNMPDATKHQQKQGGVQQMADVGRVHG